MGAGISKERLGERVMDARKKLAAAKKMQTERTSLLMSASPETLDAMVRSISEAFKSCAPFSEPTLLVAFEANPEEVQRVLSKACKQVLSAPIKKDEYAWFKKYVFPSSVWFLQTKDGVFMYERMLKITKSLSEKIDVSLDSIYTHLQSHAQWESLLAIENQDIVLRQDDERVGLLQGQGIRDVAESKQDEGEDLAAFVDSNLAVNVLTTTAAQLNAEFQGRLRMVMSRFGDFRAGPVKTVERSQSKFENEYAEAAYPSAARLLDLVRCSVSFNTVEQLLAGYDGLRRHIESTPSSFELARVKNSFRIKDAAL